MGHDIAAMRHHVVTLQVGIVLGHIRGNVELHLRYGLSARISQHLVDYAGYVEYDVLVGRVAVVSVAMPVAATDVYLDIAHPEHAVYLHLGLQKVGAGVTVVAAGVEHLHTAPIGGGEHTERKYFVLPAVMKKLFHGF
jgi:hypothetical protein